ncbi:MAG: hypothetical protein Kow00107_08690 [Planctomycetota bacterium]
MPHRPRPRTLDKGVGEELFAVVPALIVEFPTFGIRRIWAVIRRLKSLAVNRKRIDRIMRLRGFTMRLRKAGKRPRVEVTRSATD